MTEFESYYDTLKNHLKSYDNYEKFIDYGPELFKFLTNLLNEKKIGSKSRLKINSAIAYFVIPLDVIPEQIYGPYGYVDDIFICTYVIKDLANEYGYELLASSWEGPDNLNKVIDLCYNQSSKIVEENIKDILFYSGLGE